ncbi:MAG: 3-deoxy-D-manno-octulosonic acid transferase [Gemmatimonas sp.]
MHPLLGVLYAGGVSVARAASLMAPDCDGKIWRSLRARRGLLTRWERAAAATRDPSRPLVWLHAPSVGEGLQARPVAHALRAARPDVQQAYSFFSPSAERFAARVGAELTDYLPFDGATEAERMLDALRPDLLVFVKLDVWPVLVARAVARGVPVAMLSATLSAGSGRRSGLAQALLHDAYAALSAVGAIDAANADRRVALGVRREVVHVTGDTRFDQVWARAQGVDRASPLLRLLASDRPTLVAGSTWPSDEAVLLPAWRAARAAVPRARLIVAPHEPTVSHVTPMLAWARGAGLQVATLADVERAGVPCGADVLVVDRVGVLGDLYALATAAFVGGGFHSAGLHSAIEPAAFGAPVVFGPGHHMSREAGLLLEAGGGAAVADAGALAAVLRTWLADGGGRDDAGGRARALVQAELGATARSVGLIEGLLRG